MTRDEVIASLNSTMEQTLSYFDLEDQLLQRTYGEGKWSVRQILHHLCDAELIFLERLKRIIAEPKQVIWAYDQDLWNEAFDYSNDALGDKKLLYKMCRLSNIALVAKYYEAFRDKEFVHSEAGIRKLGEEFERVSQHNLSHIKQIRAALRT